MEDYDDIEQVPIDSEKIYQRDIYFYTLMPDEATVSRAIQGDDEAKRQMILGLLRVIYSYATRKQIFYDKRRIDVSTDFKDLVSTGNFILVEKLEEALQHPNPIGYLLKFAWYEMRQFQGRYERERPCLDTGIEKQQIIAFLSAWLTECGSEWFPIRQIIERIKTNEIFAKSLPDFLRYAFADEKKMTRKKLAITLAKWLQYRIKNSYGDLHIETKKDSSNTGFWRVVPTDINARGPDVIQSLSHFSGYLRGKENQ